MSPDYCPLSAESNKICIQGSVFNTKCQAPNKTMSCPPMKTRKRHDAAQRLPGRATMITSRSQMAFWSFLEQYLVIHSNTNHVN